MTIRVVRLGTKRVRGEGVRIGTVRFPPRGVPKSQRGVYFDVWLPNLAPAAATFKFVMQTRNFPAFFRKYEAEMKRPENGKIIDLLAALSHSSNFSVGCYCEDESQCHRSVLRRLLLDRGAKLK